MRGKKLTAVLLALCLLVGLLPTAAITARADGEQYKVSVSVGKSGTGTVRINDRPDAEGDTVYLERGAAVTLTATPAEGYRLAYWIGPGGFYRGDPGMTTINTTVGNDNITYTAHFVSTAPEASAEIKDIDLGTYNEGYDAGSGSYYESFKIKSTITIKNTGGCKLYPAGVRLNDAGKNYFGIGRMGLNPPGELVQNATNSIWYIYAKPDLTVGTYTATITLLERCQGALSEPVTATVTFTVTDDPVIETNAIPSNGGTVTGAGVYKKGDPVTLTATPNEHYKFVKWSDGNTENPRTFTAAEP
ncbi:MAG: hypothetical protein J5449_06160, partial [Oscillospiraceae bacterium]|nr:hypothetical protein [Oscillospiraceae bacterium]